MEYARTGFAGFFSLVGHSCQSPPPAEFGRDGGGLFSPPGGVYTAQLPSYYTKPQNVWGRVHASDERYTAWSHEIIPIKEKKGTRTYIMMQLEPQLTLTVGLYKKPKHYADQDSAIGEAIGKRKPAMRRHGIITRIKLSSFGSAFLTHVFEGILYQKTKVPWLLKPYSHLDLARELKALLVPTVH